MKNRCEQSGPAGLDTTGTARLGGRETNKQQISLARQKSDNQYKSEDDDTQATSETQTHKLTAHQVEDTQVSASAGLPHIP